MENVGSVHVRLQPNEQRGTIQLIKADVEISGATIFIILQRETRWPFRIENLSDHQFTMIQSVFQNSHRHGLSRLMPLQNESGSAPDKAPKYELEAKSAIDYAWDFPAAQEKFIRLTMNGFSRVIQMTEIGSLLPFKFLVSG